MSTTITTTAKSHLTSQASEFDRHGYLFGQKLAASMSPLLHDVVYRGLGLNWGQIRLDSTDMDLFFKLIRHPDFYGASVTMPHKVAIIPHLDELTEECREVGACNTLFIRERPDGSRVFCGANTDVIGIRESFLQNIASPATVFENRPGLVIGSGGAARSAVYALRKWLKATEIYIVNRDKDEVDAVITDCIACGYGNALIHVFSVEQAQSLEGPGAIVSCVPDFSPRTAEEILARQITGILLRKPTKGVMLEMCYNPSPYTALGKIADAEGWKVILGTEALIWQGIEQDKLWTGRSVDEMPIKTIQEVIAAKVAEHSQS